MLEKEIKIENEKKEKYSATDLFVNKRKTEAKSQNTSITEVKKENIFIRILNKIKKIFR